MKYLFTMFCLTIIGFCQFADASVAILDREIYRCSNGRDYGVLRHYWGGWGSGNWDLVGFCNLSVLTQERYNGRYMSARDSHSDVARCQDEDTPEVRQCYDEFTEKNGTQGGELTPILQGRNPGESSGDATSDRLIIAHPECTYLTTTMPIDSNRLIQCNCEAARREIDGLVSEYRTSSSQKRKDEIRDTIAEVQSAYSCSAQDGSRGQGTRATE